jgi:hypothetical protein
MKKLLSLLLLIPSIANAWEASVGAGVYSRRFNDKDQLGVVLKEEPLKLDASAGLALNGSFLFSASSFLKVGPEASLIYGWAGKENSQVATAMVGPSVQFGDNGFYIVLKPSFTINMLTNGYTDKVDIDTGFATSVKVSAQVFETKRFFFEPQLILSPSVEAKYSFVPSFGIIIGIESIFAPSKPVQVQPVVIPVQATPVVVEAPKEATPVIIETPKEITPVVLPTPATPVEVKSIEVKPIVVEAKPKKRVLKFNGDVLDDESLGFLENIIEIHKSTPSTIVVSYSRGNKAKKKADVLYTWFTTHGADKKDVKSIPGLKGKEIKIEVTPK